MTNEGSPPETVLNIRSCNTVIMGIAQKSVIIRTKQLPMVWSID